MNIQIFNPKLKLNNKSSKNIYAPHSQKAANVPLISMAGEPSTTLIPQ